MADLLFEQLYYDAYRAGLDYGNSLVGQQTPDELPEDVEQSLRSRARKQAAQLDRMIVNSPEQKESIAELVNEWMRGDEPLTLNDLRAELASDFSEARALTIARTEIGWAFNTANAAAMRAAGFEKVQWVAVMDSATCEACQELDGTIMSMDEYNEVAIVHPNCSCVAIPANDEDEENADLDAAAGLIDQEPSDLGAGDLDRDPPDA